MGIDITLYRCRIGTFCMPAKCKYRLKTWKVNGTSVRVILRLAAVLAVLVTMGGDVELNPGPPKGQKQRTLSCVDAVSSPGQNLGTRPDSVSKQSQDFRSWIPATRESGGNKLLNKQAADEGGPDGFISNSGKGRLKINIEPNAFRSNVEDYAENETQKTLTVQQELSVPPDDEKYQTPVKDLGIKSVKETKQFSQTELESGRQSNTNHKRKIPRKCCTPGKLKKVSSCHPNGQSDNQHAVTRPPSPTQSQDKPINLTTSSQSLVSNDFGRPDSDQREVTVEQKEGTVDQRKKSQTEEENTDLGIKSVKETKQFSQTELESVKYSGRQSNTNDKRKLPRKCCTPGKLKKVSSCHPNGQSDYQHAVTRPPSPAQSQDKPIYLTTSSQSLVSNYFGTPNSDQREFTVQQQEVTVDQRKKSQTEEENKGLQDVTTEETQDKATFQQPPTPDPSQPFKHVSLTTGLAAQEKPLCNLPNLFALGMGEDFPLPNIVGIKDKLRKKILSKK